MTAEQCLAVHELRREVMSTRPRGRVIIEFADGAAELDEPMARQAGDSLLTLTNLSRLGRQGWLVDRARAAEIISTILQWHLTSQASLTDATDADAVTGRILDFFPGETLGLTNIRPSADLTLPPHRWTTESQSNQRDAGVILVSQDLSALLWVVDRE